MKIDPRIVAVDFGRKRVGVAVADPLRIFARPHGTFSPDEAVVALREIQEKDGIAVMVVGWPLTLEGEEGDATALVQPYINRLHNAFPGAEIVKWDERFTSEQARRKIREAGVRRRGRREKGRVDAAAAAIILQEYLDDTRDG
jgi:putative holliday junction resolvase